jgi:hypothetical protein
MLAVALFLLTFAFGPAVGASHALASGVPFAETAILISAIHLLLVPIWFWIFRFLKYELRYRRWVLAKLGASVKITKRIEGMIEENLRNFERGKRRWSLGGGLFVFTFMMGVSWAALIASFLNIRASTIFPSIAAGAVATSLFWTAALSGIMPFLPETWMIFLVTGVLTLALLAHGKAGESRAVQEMSKLLRKLGIRMNPRRSTR